MNIPLIDLKLQYQSIKSEIKEAVDEVLESQRFILGEKVSALEESIMRHIQSPFAVGVASGSDALLLSLMAMDIKPGDEVITTPYTFISTASSVSRLGAKPVFVDVDSETFNIDPSKIEEKITKKTKAIIPVHLFGQCADMDPILDIARKHRLAVIEDAAQALGAQYRSCMAGAMGAFGCFSFFPTKNLGGFGDGGMVVTGEAKYAEAIRMLRVHGSNPKYYNEKIGLSSRLDALQAAVLNVKLKYLEQWSEKRIRNAAKYDELLKDTDVQTPFCAKHNVHIYNQYTIRVSQRNELREYLSKNGVSTEVYYPLPLHLQKCYKDLGYKEGEFPQAEKASHEVVSLPIYPELTDAQIEYVVGKIRSFCTDRNVSYKI